MIYVCILCFILFFILYISIFQWKDKINELRKEAAFITLIMKKLNRVEKTRTKISRERINKERHQVDVAQLKLDNLLCEIQHLRREIDKCLKFK